MNGTAVLFLKLLRSECADCLAPKKVFKIKCKVMIYSEKPR